jgi:hypothetical protein
MIPTFNPFLVLWAARLLQYGHYKPINPHAKQGEYELADHVYEQRQAAWDIENPVDKTGWSPVYTPTSDSKRLADNYEAYLNSK